MPKQDAPERTPFETVSAFLHRAATICALPPDVIAAVIRSDAAVFAMQEQVRKRGFPSARVDKREEP